MSTQTRNIADYRRSTGATETEAAADLCEQIVGRLEDEIKKLKGDLACANLGGLKLLYEIRAAIGWNGKTSLDILPNGCRRLRKRAEDAEAKLAVMSAPTEGLIEQLPETHEGASTWLLNYGRGERAIALRAKRNIKFDARKWAETQLARPA
jgi:hypothetical protein